VFFRGSAKSCFCLAIGNQEVQHSGRDRPFICGDFVNQKNLWRLKNSWLKYWRSKEFLKFLIVTQKTDLQMFVTWKVSDIIEVIKDIIYVLCILLGTVFLLPSYLAILFFIAWAYDNWEDITDVKPLGYVEPLTYVEQKEMGQLHHSKFYQERCYSYRNERYYNCDTHTYIEEQ